MVRLRPRWPGLTSAALSAVLIATPAYGQEVAFTGSVQFATGTYFFTDRTNSVFVVGGLDVTAGPVWASVSLPFATQSPPWLLPGAHLVIPSGGSQQAAVGHGLRGRGKGGVPAEPVVLPTPESSGWTSGLGDPLVRVSAFLRRTTSRGPAVSASGGFKIPVASVERGLGTGEWDYSAGLSVSQPIDRTLIMVDLFYWRLGDLPDLPLEDCLSYSVGVGRILGAGNVSVMGSFLGATRILEGTVPPRSLSVVLSYLAAPGRSLTLGSAVGLTETAPDFSIWLGWRVRV